MNRRALAAVVAALVSLGAACTSSGSADPDAEVVEVFGPWRGTDADRFAAVLAPFEVATGIDVRYVGSVDFVADLLERTRDGSQPPDVAMVPQPSLVRELASSGDILPIDPATLDEVIANFGEETAELGRYEGRYYTVPFRVIVKSLVWYRPDVFAEYGWSIPTTLDELDELADRIQEESDLAPWCLGINAGSATGWVATDWAEDIVLRTLGPEQYQRWVDGGLRFGDDEIAAAFERFRSLALAAGRVQGGSTAIIETPVDEAILPLLADQPACALHRQADFAANWLPDGTEVGDDGDVDVFVMPGVAEGPPPILLGGDQAVRFRQDPSVDALMNYLTSADAAAVWASEGGFLSLNRDVPDDAYPDDHLRELTEALENASSIAFDASDQMPAAIGTGVLWERITAWVAGTDDYATFAAAVDAAFDELAGSTP